MGSYVGSSVGCVGVVDGSTLGTNDGYAEGIVGIFDGCIDGSILG